MNHSTVSRKKGMRVTSSCLCKKLEGAIFPLLVEAVKDGKDDSVHTVNVGESHHGSSPSTDFDKTTFNDVGGPHGAPHRFRTIEEVQQFRKILLQPTHHAGVGLLPAESKALEGLTSLLAADR